MDDKKNVRVEKTAETLKRDAEANLEDTVEAEPDELSDLDLEHVAGGSSSGTVGETCCGC